MSCLPALLLLASLAAGADEKARPEWLVGRWRHERPLGIVRIRLDLSKDGSSHFRMWAGSKLQEEASTWSYKEGELHFGAGKAKKAGPVWKIKPGADKGTFVWNPADKDAAQTFTKVTIPAPFKPAEFLKQPAPKDFKKYLARCREELAEAQLLANEKWGVGDSKRWDVDGDTITFQETAAGHKKVTGKIQIVGSFNSANDTWLWAWANKTVAKGLTRDAAVLKEFGEKHKIKRLTEAGWDGEMTDGWDMAALSLKASGGECVYRGPAGKLYIFMIVRDLKAAPGK